jgi:perosamine synthetase
VHLYGHPADMTALQELCRPRGIALVEDAAQAHGATWHGRPVGGLGDVGSFSFFGNKILTTGEGGMVTTTSTELADRVRLLRGQAMDPQRRYWFTELGYNYRLTNVASALGVAQLQRADELIGGRNAVAAAYEHHLAGVEQIRTPRTAPGARRVAWCYTVALPDDGTGALRDGVARELGKAGIDTRPAFIPLHVMPVHHRDLVLPVTEEAGRTGLSLPTHTGLTEDDIERICAVLVDAVHRLRGAAL